jgi:hypothetical protein
MAVFPLDARTDLRWVAKAASSKLMFVVIAIVQRQQQRWLLADELFKIFAYLRAMQASGGNGLHLGTGLNRGVDRNTRGADHAGHNALRLLGLEFANAGQVRTYRPEFAGFGYFANLRYALAKIDQVRTDGPASYAQRRISRSIRVTSAAGSFIEVSSTRLP